MHQRVRREAPAASPGFAQLLSELLVAVDEILVLVGEAEIDREVHTQFAAFMGKLRPVAEEFREKEDMHTPAVRKAVGSLKMELARTRFIVKNFNSKASSLSAIEEAAHDLGRCLGLVLLASLDVSPEMKEKMGALHKEMINAKFISSSDEQAVRSSRLSNVKSVGRPETEDLRSSGVEDAVLLLKNGSEEEFGFALVEVRRLVEEKLATDDWILENKIISALLNRLLCTKHDHRLPIISILRSLATENDANKEKMADSRYLSAIVKSLARDSDERREAVGLLFTLSENPKVRQRLGRVQGCIVMLVSMLNSDDSCASNAAAELLNALSNNTQNILHMAEAGYFKPLVHCLRMGSDMNKILMATALSRMELTDQTRAVIGERGAIEPLANMFISGKLEAKLAALTALQNLSSIRENVKLLISSGIVSHLLQLLFSVTSALMTLQEPASAILASIAQSECAFVNKNVAEQMLSLLSLSSPVVQYHLLRALNSMASQSKAIRIRAKMMKNGAIQLILPFLTVIDTEIRTLALAFLSNLSKDSWSDLTEQLGEAHLIIIINIISSSTSENEKAAALGVISNLPVSSKQSTEILKRENLLPVIVSLFWSLGPPSSTSIRNWLLESIAGVFIRFTVSSDKKLQRFSAELGVIPCLVKLLSTGSVIAQSRAATSLAQLSQNSIALSKAKSSKWICVSQSSGAFCEVHEGCCSVKSTFCLVKCGAISSLVRLLDGKERQADESVLSALATLLQDEIWENGSKAIEKASGVQAITKILEIGSRKALEKAVWMLERIFRTEDHRSKYGESAEVLLIDLAQNGDPTLKPMIAKILAHFQLLPMQSSYF